MCQYVCHIELAYVGTIPPTRQIVTSMPPGKHFGRSNPSFPTNGQRSQLAMADSGLSVSTSSSATASTSNGLSNKKTLNSEGKSGLTMDLGGPSPLRDVDK